MGRKIGKLSAMAGNTDGFVANRSRAPFNTEMVILLEEGCLPEQVDKVMVDFGYPMGPFAVGDLAGLDIGYASRKRRAAENPNFRKQPIPDRLVEMGRYGQKTGAGWYRYEKGDRTPHPDPEVADDHQGSRDRSRTSRSATSPTRRSCAACCSPRSTRPARSWRRARPTGQATSTSCGCTGSASRAIAAGCCSGPTPSACATVYNQIAAWHQQYGERWAPSRLLRDLAEAGTPFREAKAAAFVP